LSDIFNISDLKSVMRKTATHQKIVQAEETNESTIYKQRKMI